MRHGCERRHMTALLAIVAVAGGVSSSVRAQDCLEPPDWPAAWWPADGSLYDFAGRNDAQLQNGAGFAPAVVGDGFYLDGVDDDVIVPDAPELNFGTSSFTVQVWINLHSVTASNIAPIISKRIERDWRRGWILQRNGWHPWLGFLRFYIGDGRDEGFNVASDTSVVWNRDIHVVVVVDRENAVLRMYVDGELQQHQPDISGLGSVDNTGPVRMGRSGEFLENAFGGVIDEPALFKRALTTEEVEDLYDAGADGMCKERPVRIDVRPGSDANELNLSAHGVLPVVVYSNELFDARSIDLDTVELAGAPIAVRGRRQRLMVSEQDVDGDGFVDLVLKFDIDDLDPDALADGEAWFTAWTLEGRKVAGFDHVELKRSAGRRR